ncbi:MAG: hypothetical protein NXH75_13915 [Halobacteriovoraceae bacterium]|nr:hypothetical protein [Halobacteriovoraceae bacterium]
MTGGSNKKGTGVNIAAEMLSALDTQSQKRVIDLMAKKDPQLTDLIKQNMVCIDDLTSMTSSMIQDLFKNIKIDKFAVALKLAEEETQNFFYENVSRSMKEELLDIVEQKKMKKSEVEKIHSEVMEVILKMVNDGQIVLGNSGEEYV